MTGLRESARARRRRSLADAAMRLFAERGWAGVTCEQIAAEAGVAARTFYTYFPTKEDVVFADEADDLAALRTRLAGRGTVPALDVLQDAVRVWMTDEATDAELLRARLQEESPAVAARARDELGRYERLLAEALNADLGAGPDDVRGAVLAAQLTGGWDLLGRRLLCGTLDRDDFAALLGLVVDSARAGLEVMRSSPGRPPA